MPSGEVRMILITCKATIGAVSNPDHNLEVHGKAGRKRWLGVRPRTRAVVMNPLITLWVAAKVVLQVVIRVHAKEFRLKVTRPVTKQKLRINTLSKEGKNSNNV